MKLEDMEREIGGIIGEACSKALKGSEEPYIEEASKKVTKVFEKALKEQIGEAAKMIPGLGKLLGGLTGTEDSEDILHGATGAAKTGRE